MILADDVQVHVQILWRPIGWTTGAALADPNGRTILIASEGSLQLSANEIGNANPIIFVLNNDGYRVERALELNPDWSDNDLAEWRCADVPWTLGCADWAAERVETIDELDAAMKAAPRLTRAPTLSSSADEWICREASHSPLPALTNSTETYENLLCYCGRRG
jgi:indolepyruvate decarboxylase